jgi:hypothetical protein
MVSFTLTSVLTLGLVNLSSARPVADSASKPNPNEYSFVLIADGYPILSLNARRIRRNRQPRPRLQASLCLPRHTRLPQRCDSRFHTSSYNYIFRLQNLSLLHERPARRRQLRLHYPCQGRFLRRRRASLLLRMGVCNRLEKRGVGELLCV